MDSLKHGVFLADVCAARRADAALELGGLVGDYVAVKVGQDEYLEVLAPLGVDEFCGGDVDIPLISRYLGIFLAYLLAEVEEFAVGGLYDVCLLDY